MKQIKRFFFLLIFLCFSGCDFPFFVEDDKYTHSAELVVHNQRIERFNRRKDISFFLQKEFFGGSRREDDVVSQTKVVSSRDSCTFVYDWSSHVQYDNYDYVYILWKEEDDNFWNGKKIWLKAGEVFQAVLNDDDELTITPSFSRE